MLDTPCSEVLWRVLATHSIGQFPLHFPYRASPCAITFHLDSTMIYPFHTSGHTTKMFQWLTYLTLDVERYSYQCFYTYWSVSRYVYSFNKIVGKYARFFLCFVDHPSLYILFQLKPNMCTLLHSVFISTSLHFSGNYVPIIRRTYCIYATLVFVILKQVERFSLPHF